MKWLWAVFVRSILLLAVGLFASDAVALCWRCPPIGLGLLAASLWHKFRRPWRTGNAHGTAKFAGWWDLLSGGLLGRDGLILGTTGYLERPNRWQALRALLSPAVRSATACMLFLNAALPRGGGHRMIRLQRPVHLATFAPSGRGKGVSVIIPNLLSYRGSVVTVDPKGENYLITAAHRRRRFGQRIFRLDPYGLCGPGSDQFNPLQFIDETAADFIDQCRDVANQIVVRQGTEKDPHWNDAAEMVITSVIAYICACAPPAERNLGSLRHIVSSRDTYTDALALMKETAGFGDIISRMGNLLGWFQDKELASVLTTVQRHTQFLDSPAIAANTADSTFDPRELRGGSRSLYLILPPDRLVTMAPLMRMWLGNTIRILARDGTGESSPVLFLIDEAGHLGKIQALEDAVTLMRGMGIRLWFFFQSLSQLKVCYGDKAAVFLDNFDTQQYFGTNSYESAEAISQRIGSATVSNVQYGSNDGYSHPHGGMAGSPQSGSRSGGTSHTVSDMEMRLIRPEQILGLAEDVALVMHRNLPPIPARLLRYYSAPEFKRGRCGDSRGPGVAAGIAAVTVLCVSLGFSSIFAMLPLLLPPAAPRRVEYRPAAGWRLPAVSDPFDPYPIPRPVRRPAPRMHGYPDGDRVIHF